MRKHVPFWLVLFALVTMGHLFVTVVLFNLRLELLPKGLPVKPWPPYGDFVLWADKVFAWPIAPGRWTIWEWLRNSMVVAAIIAAVVSMAFYLLRRRNPQARARGGTP